MSLRSDPEKLREYNRNWSKKKFSIEENREKRRKQHREYERGLRIKVLNLLGGKCVKCGCTIPEALEINHINGGGRQERPNGHRGGKQFSLDILKGRRNISDLEINCRICNAWHFLTQIKDIKDGWTITWKE